MGQKRKKKFNKKQRAEYLKSRIRKMNEAKLLKTDVAVENPNTNVNNSELHKCTQCEKEFKTFEDIKIHFLETHTKWEKDESSVEGRQTNVSIEKESIYSETSESKANNDLTPTVNEKEDNNSSHHNLSQETLHSKPTSKSKTQKIEIIFECELKNCGKSFKNFGDLEIHKKTQHVDKSSKKCTKCDAEFDSFEILKHHFLQTHTKWRKEDKSNESKDNEDVIIVNEKAEDPKNNFIKDNINNCTKMILNSKKVEKCLQVNTITTDPNVPGFLTLNTEETIRQKQPVSNINDTVFDDPKNTFIIFSENAIVDSSNTPFIIVKTKPDIDNSTSNIQDNLLFQLLSNSKESYVTKNEASCFSSFFESITPDPKPTADFCQNLMTDLRNNKTNVIPVVKPTPNAVYYMPYERNTTSSVSNERPVAKDILVEPMDISVEIKNTSSDVANTTPKVKSVTSDVANTTTEVKSVTSDVANTTTEVKSVTSDVANTTTEVKSVTSDVANTTPEVKSVTSDVANTTPEVKSVTSDVANTTPKVKSVTSDVANTTLDVSKIISMVENFLPVMRNIKSNPTVKPAVKKARQIRKYSNQRCYCFNCLSGANDGFDKVMVHMCSDCGQEFINKIDYCTHIRTHDPFRIYHCPLSCGKRFDKPGMIFSHVPLHSQWEFNVCKICKKGFHSVTELERHSHTYHNRKPPEIRVNLDSDNNEINDEINLEVQSKNGNIEIANQASSLSIGPPNGRSANTAFAGAGLPLQQLGTPTTISSSDHMPRPFPLQFRDSPSYELGNSSLPTDLLISDLASLGYSEHGSYKKTQAYPKGKSTIEITNDVSEVEDNDANPITETSDEESSSSEENTVNDITNAPGLVEDEVYLELAENFVNNIPPDPLSDFEEKPQIILNKEESVGAIPEGIRNLNAENMELDLSMQTEQSIKPVLYHIVNIEESVECMSLVKIETEREMRQMKNTEERTESFPNQIVNIDKEGIEYTPLARVKREVECIESVPENTDERIESVPEQMINMDENVESVSEHVINTDESVELIPTKRIKREVVSINLVPGQRIHVADADLVMRSLNGNRCLQVDIERLPF